MVSLSSLLINLGMICSLLLTTAAVISGELDTEPGSCIEVLVRLLPADARLLPADARLLVEERATVLDLALLVALLGARLASRLGSPEMLALALPGRAGLEECSEPGLSPDCSCC